MTSLTRGERKKARGTSPARECAGGSLLSPLSFLLSHGSHP